MSLDSGKQMIIYFDTQCMYCNFFAMDILKNDRSNTFLFGSTHSISFQKLNLTEDSIYLVSGDSYSHKSTAVIQILKSLGGWRGVIGRFVSFVPISIRDRIYDFIARNRMRIPAPKSCYMPTPDERVKILDN